MRIAFALLAATACAVTAHSASFDCSAARSPVERAICNDTELSALDGELADTYLAVLARQDAPSASQLRSEQRQWLKLRTDSSVEVLKQQYVDRINELAAYAAFPAPGEHVGGPVFHLTQVAKQFDFTLRMLQACPASEETCEGPGQLLIHGKGKTALLQTINLPNVFVTLPRGKEGPLVNSARLYDYQGVINVGDFNFDGHEDFGIQTGNKGSYGGPSYAIYLFKPTSQGGNFIFNAALTDLILETLGFFSVDEQKKRIWTFGKSGCCYHEMMGYRIKHDMPVVVERHIEDATAIGEDSEKRKVKIIDEQFINGKWQRKTRYEPMRD
jgi:uncharacterized protein